MSKKKIEKAIELYLSDDENIMLAEGFEKAFVGIGRQFDRVFAVYDREKCISILCETMSLEEAEEYFQFNVEGAWVGEATPAFINLI